MKSLTKISLLCVVALFYITTSYAQDIIVLKGKTSDEIKVKVTEVSKKNVKYKKWSYQEGPTFSLSVDDVLIIKYQNGEEQVFSKEKKSFWGKISKKDNKSKDNKKLEKNQLGLNNLFHKKTQNNKENKIVADDKENKTKQKESKGVTLKVKPIKEKQVKGNSLKKWEFGAYAGLTMGNWYGESIKEDKQEIMEMNKENKDQYSFRYDFHVGAFVKYNILNYLFVEADLLFNRKGYSRKTFITSGSTWDDDSWNYNYSSSYKMVTNHVEVPIYIGGKWGDFSIKAGAYVSYAIFGGLTETYEREDFDTIHSSEVDRGTKSTDIKDSESKYNPFSYGVVAGLEYDITDRVFIGATYQRGFTSLVDEKDVFDHNIMFSVGYKF